MPAFLGGIATITSLGYTSSMIFVEMPAFLGGIATSQKPTPGQFINHQVEMPAFLGGIATLTSEMQQIVNQIYRLQQIIGHGLSVSS